VDVLDWVMGLDERYLAFEDQMRKVFSAPNIDGKALAIGDINNSVLKLCAMEGF